MQISKASSAKLNIQLLKESFLYNCRNLHMDVCVIFSILNGIYIGSSISHAHGGLKVNNSIFQPIHEIRQLCTIVPNALFSNSIPLAFHCFIIQPSWKRIIQIFKFNQLKMIKSFLCLCVKHRRLKKLCFSFPIAHLAVQLRYFQLD